MKTKNNTLKLVLGWLLKLFIPPLVGALVLSILYEIHFFYENFDFVAKLANTTVLTFVSGIVRNFTTFFYGYYLLVYIPFFIYLVLLQKFNKLSWLLTIASGFIYGLSPLLFGSANSLNNLFSNQFNFLLVFAIAFSGALCAATYYHLDKFFKN